MSTYIGQGPAPTPVRVLRDRATMARARQHTAEDRAETPWPRRPEAMYSDDLRAGYATAVRNAYTELAAVHAQYAEEYEARALSAVAAERDVQAARDMNAGAA